MNVSLYGGVVGDVTRHFVRFGTFFGGIVPLFITGLLGAASLYLVHLIKIPTPFAFPILLIALSPVFAHYAVPARHGELDAGFFSGGSYTDEIVGFVKHYSLAVLLWAVPIAGFIAWVTARDESMSPLQPFAFGPQGWMALLVMVLIGLAVVLQFLSLIVGLHAEQPSDVLSLDTWLWPMRERRRDLIPMFVSLIGGAALFSALVIPVMTAIALLSFFVSAKLGAVLTSVTYIVPFGCAPILMGRVIGAFVLTDGREVSPDTSPQTAAAPAVAAGTGTAASVTHRATGEEVPVDRGPRTLADIKRLSESEPQRALDEALRLIDAQPTNSGLLAEVAFLLNKLGRRRDALERAKAAVIQSLKLGSNALALEIYQYFVKDRQHLGLDGEQYEQLSRVTLANHMYDDALWCVRAAEQLGVPLTRVQKRIIAIADACAAAGNGAQAVGYYQYLESTYPGSPFSDYCQRAITLLNTPPGRS